MLAARYATPVARGARGNHLSQLLDDASFQNVEVEVTRVYDASPTLPVDGGRLVSAIVRATRPTD